MPFTNKTSFLIENIDKTLINLCFDENLICTNINSNSDNVHCYNIIDGDFSFVDLWFDVSHNENIYGILNDKKGKLLNISLDKNNVDLSIFLKYDSKNFLLKFPYVRKLPNESHTIYISINKKNPYFAYLIHIYESNDIYKKNKIDFINYSILSNFIVTFENNIPSIFYFKLINGFEEIFVSTFDLNSHTWSSPIQITFSKKSKIYLSIIKDINNAHHIVFAENNNNKYFCKYIKGTLSSDKFDISNQQLISNSAICTFPHLIESNSNIYIQWVEYFNLYSCASYDLGETWTPVSLNYSISDKPFSRYEYRSSNKIYNCSTIFALEDYRIIL